MADTTTETTRTLASNDQSNEVTVVTPADQAVEVASKLLVAGLKARATRFTDIKKNEDMQAGITGTALKGRNNVPFDCFVMGGFTDTLLSNIDEPVDIKFDRTREQDKMAADKVTAAWIREMGLNKAALQDKILDAKFLGSLAGRGFLKVCMGNVPKFYTDVEVVDHWDMVVEAKGGADLDKHLYKFQMNIFRDRSDLMLAASQGFYDKAQVTKLIQRYRDTELFKKNAEILGEKASRWQAFGLETETDSYVGSQLYRLTEGVFKYRGRWMYLLFSAETKTWVRFEPLENVFAHAKEFEGRGPWVSFATHRHPFLFWSKAPADDIRPIAYTMKKIVNLTLDNLEKRNWDMTAYDPKIFKEPSQLLYRQNGLARATVRQGQNISEGIYKFQTPDTTAITINLVQWLDGFVGQKTGITPDSMGSSKEDKVGIYYGNLQQLSKRMKLANRMFFKMYVDLGTIFDYGVYQYLREQYAVKLIGNEGAQWEEEITRQDTDKDFTITVTSSIEQSEHDAATNDLKEKGFAALETNPALLSKINPQWHLRERLKSMGYSEEQIRLALDVNSDGNEEVMAKAAQAIQECLEGHDYIAMYRGATTGFIQKILDFASDKFPLVPDTEIMKLRPSEQKRYAEQMKKFDKLVAYAKDHLPIAQKNMERKLVSMISSGALGRAAPGGMPQNGVIPNPSNLQAPNLPTT